MHMKITCSNGRLENIREHIRRRSKPRPENLHSANYFPPACQQAIQFQLYALFQIHRVPREAICFASATMLAVANFPTRSWHSEFLSTLAQTEAIAQILPSGHLYLILARWIFWWLYGFARCVHLCSSKHFLQTKPDDPHRWPSPSNHCFRQIQFRNILTNLCCWLQKLVVLFLGS